jgi:hypothetical protein
VRPGGSILLATDVASEAMAPLRSVAADADLRLLLDRLVDAGDVFSSVNPRALTTIIADDPQLSQQLSRPRIGDPWLWQNGNERIFLVCALELERLEPTKASTSEASILAG